MNSVLNDSRLWFCDICDKTINFEKRLGQIKSKSHIHRKEYGSFVEDFEV